MSKLSSLVGKPKAYTIGGIELELSPRRLEEIDLLMDLAEPEKKANAMKELIKRTLKEAVPDATDEEIEKMSLTHFKALSEAIIDVNGLKENAPVTD